MVARGSPRGPTDHGRRRPSLRLRLRLSRVQRRNAAVDVLPLTRDQHASAAVTGFFEALLPEHGPARECLELESGVSRSNAFGLLAYVGRDLPGAVCIVPAGEGLPTDGGVVPLTELELAERLGDLRRSAASGGVPLSEHGQWSLAGEQQADTHALGRVF